jgi:hypothetical protein
MAKKKKKKRLNVLSPDGFAIHHENTYANKKEARAAFEEWKKNYEHQGYYSYRGQRLPLDYLHEYCSLVEV